jgi:hypothetical protein
MAKKNYADGFYAAAIGMEWRVNLHKGGPRGPVVSENVPSVWKDMQRVRSSESQRKILQIAWFKKTPLGRKHMAAFMAQRQAVVALFDRAFDANGGHHRGEFIGAFLVAPISVDETLREDGIGVDVEIIARLTAEEFKAQKHTKEVDQ